MPKARGKLKYRDVVGGGPAGRGKKNNKNNQKQIKPNNKKPQKFHVNFKEAQKKGHRKKRRFDERDDEDLIAEKKQKFEAPSFDQEEESSSEDEAKIDYEELILQNFDPTRKKKIETAIDTSSDESEAEEEDAKDHNEVDDDEESDFDEIITPSNNKQTKNVTSQPGSSEIEEDDEDDEIQIETAEEISQEDAKDDIEDPFVKHILYEFPENVLNSLQSTPRPVEMHKENWSSLGQLHIQIPKFPQIETDKKNEFSIEEEKVYALPGTVPKKIDAKLTKPEDLFIKTQIAGNLWKANPLSNREDVIFTSFQAELFSIINNYQDLLYCERTVDNADEIRFAYCVHAVNHILKTRLKVIHHNARLTNKDDVPDQFRDQGLVRPKILIIVPFKNSAYKIVNTIINIMFSENKGNVMNRKRFIEEYTGNEIAMPKKHPKPEDYELIFSGNSSDDFKIGITVTKKSLKLYADFYSADIIIASPLGLRTIIGAPGEPDRDFDFLASIELLILDQADVILMQNWFHLVHIFDHLHLQPKESHGTDFSRVRFWSLNGWAKYYRQTLIFSSINSPLISALITKKSCNYAGNIRIWNAIKFGAIKNIYVELRHFFHKFDSPVVKDDADARFNFFIRKILPRHRESMMNQTLIFVPSYFDYIRLRNHFKKEDIGFVQICEYSKGGKIARARDMFFHGDAKFLLYSERYHFFNRIRIKGIRHLIFYQPPVFPHFYSEMCNLMQKINQNRKLDGGLDKTVTVIFSKWDSIHLAPMVGTERAATMIESDRTVYTMSTEAL